MHTHTHTHTHAHAHTHAHTHTQGTYANRLYGSLCQAVATWLLQATGETISARCEADTTAAKQEQERKTVR